MQIPARLMWGAATLLTATSLLALAQREGHAKGEDAAAQASATWNDTCQKCHTVPDATFETGRAFLAQITETS